MAHTYYARQIYTIFVADFITAKDGMDEIRRVRLLPGYGDSPQIRGEGKKKYL